MNVATELWDLWLVVDEPIGAALGVVVVLCLIRQNLWAWPLGVVYVLTSITVLIEGRLYANLLLHVVGFLPMNLYGWYYWIYGKDEDQDELAVTQASWLSLGALAAICTVSAGLIGAYFAAGTNAAFPFADSGVFVVSLSAMWMTARKKIDNWIVWFVVNVVSVYLYFAQGLTLYALLYLAYIGMAVAGYLEWRKAMIAATAPHLPASS